MPNIFTAVPDNPVSVPQHHRSITRIADSFMKAMWSTPSSGTLRTTWVTPASIGLAGVLAVALWLTAVRLLASAGLIQVVASVTLILAGAWCGSVAELGIAQRVSARRRH